MKSQNKKRTYNYMFRIQKLLFSEFRGINEPIIIENPFTQVTENGYGLQQFHIGLTPSKIIFGRDDLNLYQFNEFYYQNADPEIETFELCSLIPLQFLKFQFYRKQGREIMQITIYNDDLKYCMYFEFGGHLYRNMFWNTWRERISTICMQPKFWHISNITPFSSTDVLADEEIYSVELHSPPSSFYTSCSDCSQVS